MFSISRPTKARRSESFVGFFQKKPVLRNGISLMELLVVVVVIGMLISLISVAISASRDVARRITCANNLRQIGLALANYEAKFRVLPRGSGAAGHGPLVAILPELELSDIFRQIDFSKDVDENPIAKRTRIPLFRCPSAMRELEVRTDYVLNRGATLEFKGDDSPWLFDQRVYPKQSSFTRGSASTALFSETCPLVDGQKKGSLLLLRQRQILTRNDSEIFVSECVNATGHERISTINNGCYWFGAGCMNYFHILPPNNRSCANGGMIQQSLYTATSMHESGVNMLFADGHVNYVSNSIENPVWVSWGSR